MTACCVPQTLREKLPDCKTTPQELTYMSVTRSNRDSCCLLLVLIVALMSLSSQAPRGLNQGQTGLSARASDRPTILQTVVSSSNRQAQRGGLLRSAGGAVSLQTFSFEVVTLDSTGRVTNKRRGQAQYYTEDLGSGVGLDMVSVPGGRFMMGTSFGEAEKVAAEHRPTSGNDIRADHFGNEFVAMQLPQRPVTINAFFIGKFEVTQAQWRIVAELPKVNKDLSAAPSYSKGNDLPVEELTWEDTVEFCARLSQATGRTYRLPSEAEWEYACRAGATTQFCFGDTVTPELVNYNGEYPYGSAPRGLDRDETLRVGSLGVANAFGLFDMHGNVQEWCMDPWHENYNGAPWDGRGWITQGGSAWLGCGQDYRVVRGGSFHQGPYRSADRGRLWWTNNKNYFTGFRVVCSAR
jgi:formylglycine-generating enzyme required for sulfatase activity